LTLRRPFPGLAAKIVAAGHCYGNAGEFVRAAEDKSKATPFVAMTETFELFSPRNVLRGSVVECHQRESSVARMASICRDWASAMTFLRSAQSSFTPEPLSLFMPLISFSARIGIRNAHPGSSEWRAAG
jgi:hypothetical protein